MLAPFTLVLAAEAVSGVVTFDNLSANNNIINARFGNTTGQGVVWNNIYAIPEPSSLLLAACSFILSQRRTGARISFRPIQNH